jgi:hypothetical protein
MRLSATNTVPMEHLTPFEESHIPSKQQALLAVAHGCKSRVIGEAFVPSIEAEHPKVSGETPEMAVENEPGIAEAHRRRMWKHLNFFGID